MEKYNLNMIIFILMTVTGFLIYFMYFKIQDNFGVSTTTNPMTTFTAAPTATPTAAPTAAPTTAPPVCTPVLPDVLTNSIMSRFFGVGFNIEYIKEADGYLINHIPTISSGILGGCYAISSDILLTNKLKY